MGLWTLQHLCQWSAIPRHQGPPSTAGNLEETQPYAAVQGTLTLLITDQDRHRMSTAEQSSREKKIVDEYINFIANTFTQVDVNLTELTEASLKYITLQTVIKMIESGRWQETKN